jgi:hypothetical protein
MVAVSWCQRLKPECMMVPDICSSWAPKFLKAELGPWPVELATAKQFGLPIWAVEWLLKACCCKRLHSKLMTLLVTLSKGPKRITWRGICYLQCPKRTISCWSSLLLVGITKSNNFYLAVSGRCLFHVSLAFSL